MSKRIPKSAMSAAQIDFMEFYDYPEEMGDTIFDVEQHMTYGSLPNGNEVAIDPNTEPNSVYWSVSDSSGNLIEDGMADSTAEAVNSVMSHA